MFECVANRLSDIDMKINIDLSVVFLPLLSRQHSGLLLRMSHCKQLSIQQRKTQ